ncbi:hypothetical protein ACFLX4_03515 [Chloroflexota bacterium]
MMHGIMELPSRYGLINSKGDKNTVGYEKRIFAFVDILGFADLVEESERDTAKILRIYQLLDRTKSMAHIPIGHKFETLKVDLAKFRSHTFSDTFTMSCPYESFDYFNAIIAWIMRYQYFMWAEEGTFLRGAVVYDKIFDEENSPMVFGPAMVAAYRLETNTAKWPRILIASSMMKELPDEKRIRALKENIRKDNAGNYYLDYLRDLFALTCYDKGKRLNSPSDPIALLQSHKVAIEKAVEKIYKQSGKTQSFINRQRKLLNKYSRLSKYHNSVVIKLYQVALNLQNNSDLIRSISSEVLAHGLIEELGWQQHFNIEPEFTAENLKYIDIMPILGIAIDRIINEQEDIESLVHNDPVKFIEFLCEKSPKYLSELQKSLHDTKIDTDKLRSDKWCCR